MLQEFGATTMVEAMQVLSTYRFTVDEYHRLGEAGILGEDDRVELLNGDLITMAPIGGQHRTVAIFKRGHCSPNDQKRRTYVWPLSSLGPRFSLCLFVFHSRFEIRD